MNNPNGIPQTWQDIETILGEMRELAASRDTLLGERDAAVAEIAQRYAKDIDPIEARLAAARQKVTDFMEANKGDFGEPGSRGRFRDFLHGRIGYRQTTPKLETLRNLTIEQVIEYMLARKERFGGFIRIVHELNRPAIIGNMDKDTRVEVGLTVTQEDRPYVDLKTG